ncbi:uncharacterized protein I206_101249 [Kwoniella pini CBS 10737]|uniref:Uncharacterized protein n=1 Tax=Kwoniella pini CBS 10737 TaxID=1296096 RepID=A0A1B9IBK6_9TREE|nr:uncharacterized protein I206_00073 [Kwoniella pini CBS 10737]OCF52777.1 hypothetical protein I206_00073 [Kwoniella pini CBS 10737]
MASQVISPIKKTHPPPLPQPIIPTQTSNMSGGYTDAHPTDEEMFKRRYVAIQDIINELEDENNLIAYRIAKFKKQKKEKEQEELIIQREKAKQLKEKEEMMITKREKRKKEIEIENDNDNDNDNENENEIENEIDNLNPSLSIITNSQNVNKQNSISPLLNPISPIQQSNEIEIEIENKHENDEVISNRSEEEEDVQMDDY